MNSRWDDVDRSIVLEQSSSSPGSAREVVMGLCRAANVECPTAQTALLLTSEIVTNALTHGRGAPVLSIEIHAATLRVSVTDEAPERPQLISPPSTASVGGRGVFLVDTLATRWGVREIDSGAKSVWFELDHP